MTYIMVLKSSVILVLAVTVFCEEWIKRPTKYYSYPSRFYGKPPPPRVVSGAFSFTPPPNYMQDDEPHYRPKVSKKPTNDGLGDAGISNLIKHLTKTDLDKIVEFAGEKRYAENYRDDSSEKFVYKPYRPESNSGYRNEGVEQFSRNIHRFKEQEDILNEEYNGPNINYGAVRPRIVHATPPSFLDDFDKNPKSDYINDASKTKVIYTSPPERYNSKVITTNPHEQQFSNNGPPSNPSVIFSNPQSQLSSPPFSVPPAIPSFYSSQGPVSNTPLDTEESMRQYVTYVTVPPNHNTQENTLFTDSETMKEEQLPKPLNLRDDYQVANSDNVPKVVKSDGYEVESFKDLPLMNFHDSKLRMVSSYNVPHYLVTSTKSQSAPSSSYQQVKAPTIEQAPSGYIGQEMSDAHLKAVKIWTHRSKGTAYTLHDDGTLSLEKPKTKSPYYTYGPN